MKTKIILFLIAFMPMLSNGQPISDGWFEVGNSNYNAEFTDVVFTSNAKGYAIGKAGSYLTTNDGGLTWTAYNIGINADLNRIQFLNENVGYIGASTNFDEPGYILKTIDGGNNWSIVHESLALESLVDMVFITEEIGYVANMKNTLQYTIDGGISWSEKPELFEINIRKLHFIDQLNGFIITDIGKLYKTMDAGESYLEITTTGLYAVKSLIFLNNNLGYAWDAWGNYTKTTDGGLTWLDDPYEELMNTGMYQYNDIFAVSETEVYAFHDGCDIAKTLNGGVSWEIIYSNIHNQITKVAVKPNGQFVAVGLGGLIMTSNDMANWTVRQKGYVKGNVNSISIVSESIAYIAGDFSTIAKTSNNGQTWTTYPLNHPYHLYNYTINHLSEDIGFIGNSSYRIIKTDDGWETNTMSSSTSYQNRAIVFVDENTGFAAGNPNGGGLYKTTNQGETWEALSTGIGNFFWLDLVAVGTDTLYGIATSQSFLRSFDGGDTWEEIVVSAGSFFNPASLCFVNDSVGFVTSKNIGTILKTMDRGNTWTQVFLTSQGINRIRFVDENTGYVVGDKGYMIKTSDCGNNWTQVISSTHRNLYDIAFTASGIAYAVGQDGVFLRKAPSFNAIFNVVDINNDPISDAVVTLNGIPYTAGQYILEGLIADIYTYSVTKSGFSEVAGTFTIVDQDEVIDVTLEPSFKVTFLSYNSYQLTPISGAEVTLTGYGTQTTNTSGAAVFSNLLPENGISWTIQKEHYVSQTGTVNVVDTDVIHEIVLYADIEAPVATQPADVFNSFAYLSWNPVADASAYLLFLSDDNFANHIINGSETISNQFYVGGLNASTEYQYRVKAVNQYGASVFSNVITFTTKETPDPPVALPASEITQTSFIANWEAIPNVTNYFIYLSDDNFQSILVDGIAMAYDVLHYEFVGYNPNTTYYFKLYAFIANTGETPFSNIIEITTLDNTTAISHNSENKVKIYPNPATDYLKIEGAEKADKVEILQIDGKPIMQLLNDDLQNVPTINISHLSSGIYVVRIHIDKQVVTRKLILNK